MSRSSREALIPLVLALASAALVSAPERARACTYGGCEGTYSAIGIVALTAGALNLVVLGADLDAAVHDQWLSPGWATANVLMSIVNAAGAVALFALDDGGMQPGLIAGGLVLSSLSVLMATVGALSIALRDDPPLPIRQIHMTFAPAPGGGLATLAGRF